MSNDKRNKDLSLANCKDLGDRQNGNNNSGYFIFFGLLIVLSLFYGFKNCISKDLLDDLSIWFQDIKVQVLKKESDKPSSLYSFDETNEEYTDKDESVENENEYIDEGIYKIEEDEIELASLDNTRPVVFNYEHPDKKVKEENKYKNGDIYYKRITTNKNNGEWSIKEYTYKDNIRNEREKYSNNSLYYKKFVDDLLVIHHIKMQNYDVIFKYEYDENGRRLREKLYTPDKKYIDTHEYTYGESEN